MNAELKPLIDRLLRGEVLDAAEQELLGSFEPDAMQQELAALREELNKAELAKLSNEERLQKELDECRRNSELLAGEHRALLRSRALERLAAESGFSEPEYLDFLASRENVDPTDSESARSFIEKLKTSHARYFESHVRSGSGSGENTALPQVTAVVNTADRIAKITSALLTAAVRR